MKGEVMSVNIMTIASFVAPSFTNNYPTTTWSAKRAYAHFGIEALGVNG
jgi:hypothetical protein